MSASSYTDFAKSLAPAKANTPATAPIPGREAEMGANNNGGFSFLLDQWGVLDRFLMLGSESAGYTVAQKDVAKLGFDTVIKCVREDGVRVVNRALEYSLAGRAPKNDPAVVAIALAAVYGNAEAAAAAYDALPKIARTGTWLFMFVSILDSLGKWNAAAKRGVAKWYTSKTVDKLAIQLLKYQQRNGWAHRDVLRLAHVKPTSDIQSNLFRYSVKGADGMVEGAPIPQLVIDFELLKRTDSKKTVLSIIEQNPSITWEMVPTQWLKDKDILFALTQNMGLTAVIRKLGILTANGVIAPMSEGRKLVVQKLSDVEALRSQRVHPITILQALKQYSTGQGERGSTVWRPDQKIIDTLDDSFYASFGTVEKTDENYVVGVDISGSMWGAKVNGSPNLDAATVAAVMAMAAVRNQPNHVIFGFKQNLVELPISPRMRLDQALKVMSNAHWDGGSTDASKLFTTAQQQNIHADKFIAITDNDINTGRQPVHALRDYRKAVNPKAKCVVIGTSMSQFTIADPKDAGMLDIAGFDSAAPQLIAML